MTQPVAPMGNNRIGMHITILIRELVRQNERYREALENIASTAQEGLPL